jgi:hypothetical protein
MDDKRSRVVYPGAQSIQESNGLAGDLVLAKASRWVW